MICIITTNEAIILMLSNMRYRMVSEIISIYNFIVSMKSIFNNYTCETFSSVDKPTDLHNEIHHDCVKIVKITTIDIVLISVIAMISFWCLGAMIMDIKNQDIVWIFRVMVVNSINFL